MKYITLFLSLMCAYFMLNFRAYLITQMEIWSAVEIKRKRVTPWSPLCEFQSAELQTDH